MTPTTWAALGFFLNVVWFIYAMVNQRWTRGKVRAMEGKLFSIAPCAHAFQLMKHFRLRNDEVGEHFASRCFELLSEPKPEIVIDGGYHFCSCCLLLMKRGEADGTYFCNNAGCDEQGKLVLYFSKPKPWRISNPSQTLPDNAYDLGSDVRPRQVFKAWPGDYPGNERKASDLDRVCKRCGALGRHHRWEGDGGGNLYAPLYCTASPDSSQFCPEDPLNKLKDDLS